MVPRRSASDLHRPGRPCSQGGRVCIVMRGRSRMTPRPSHPCSAGTEDVGICCLHRARCSVGEEGSSGVHLLTVYAGVSFLWGKTCSSWMASSTTALGHPTFFCYVLPRVAAVGFSTPSSPPRGYVFLVILLFSLFFSFLFLRFLPEIYFATPTPPPNPLWSRLLACKRRLPAGDEDERKAPLYRAGKVRPPLFLVLWVIVYGRTAPAMHDNVYTPTLY